MDSNLLDIIAHGGSMRAFKDNQQVDAQTRHADAATELNKAQTTEVGIKIGQQQQAQRDAQILRDIYATVGQQAHQATIAPAKLPGGLINRSGQPLDNTPSIATPPFVAPGTVATPAPQPPPQVPDLFSDPRGLAMEVARRGGSASAVQGAYVNAVKMGTEIAQMSTAQLTAEKANHEMIANSIQGYLENPTPDAYARLKADAQREPEIAAELEALGTAPTQKELAHVIGGVALTDRLIKTAESRQKMQNDQRAADNTAVAATDTHLKNTAELPAVQKKAAVDVALGDATLGNKKLLTPQQQNDADEAATTLAATNAAHAETSRHNQRTESLSAEANAIHRENAQKAKLPVNAPPAVIRSVIEKDQFVNEIDETIAELKSNKGAIGMKTMVGQKVLQTLDPKGVKARSLVAKISGREYHDISGAAVTPSEDKRLQPFIPQQTDSADAAITKLEGLKRSLASENQATREAYPDDKYREIPKPKAAEASGSPVKISGDEEFNKLKSGQEFIGPDGVRRRKP